MQDSGKTSLLNLVWGLQGSTGLFAHTDVPAMHRITSKVATLLAAWLCSPCSPGQCYRLPREQQPRLPRQDLLHLRGHEQPHPRHPALHRGRQRPGQSGARQGLRGRERRLPSGNSLPQVMAGSSSSRVVLCINKCGLYLDKLKLELAGQQSPVG